MADSTIDALKRETVERRRYSLLLDVIIRLLREKPLGTVGAVIILILFLVGMFAGLLAPYGMNEIHLADTLHPPSVKYVLGTDNLGRDVLSRIIFGARISMIVGLAGAALNTLVATIIGLTSGFFAGRFDLIIQRFVDAWMCFPPLFIILTMMAIFGPGLAQVIFVLGISQGISGSRVVRSAVVSIKENVYMEAARSIGCSPMRIVARHALPNIVAPIIIIFTLAMGNMIITEASVSFLGFGIPPPAPSWGGMLSRVGRMQMVTAPWLAFFPGLAIAIVVYGVNVLGDAMRDVLDPRLRGGLGRYVVAKVKRGKEARLKKGERG